MKIQLAMLLALAMPAAASAEGDDACRPGAMVQVERDGALVPGYVLDGPAADGTCLVSIEGPSENAEAWVPAGDVVAGGGSGLTAPATATPELCVIGAPVEVEWQGRWWASHVLDGPREDGSCYVTYDGWASRWDEWVAPDRLRLAGVMIKER